jgi:hypothetical protein
MQYNHSDPLGAHGSLLPTSEAYSEHLHTLDGVNGMRFNALLSDSLLTQGLLASTRTLFGPIEYLNSVIGQIVYLPGKDYYGIDTITYNVSDAVNDTTGSIDVMSQYLQVLPTSNSKPPS